MDERPQFWAIDYATKGEGNKIVEASEATGMNLVGLVDENVGGVVGYVLPEYADFLMEQFPERSDT